MIPRLGFTSPAMEAKFRSQTNEGLVFTKTLRTCCACGGRVPPAGCKKSKWAKGYVCPKCAELGKHEKP